MQNHALALAVTLLGLLYASPNLLAQDAATPSAEERQAVAKLIKRGASIQIDEDYAVSSISFSRVQRTSDADLELLTAFPRLKSVLVRGSGVTNAGLKHLEKVKTLTSLSLYDTSATAEGVELLRKILPECNVRDYADFRSGGTRGSTPLSLAGVSNGEGTIYGQLQRSIGQRDLQLTDEQKEKIEAVLSQPGLRLNLREYMIKHRDAKTEDERTAIREEWEKLVKAQPEVGKAADASLRKILTPQQLARVQQLILQTRGIDAILDASIVEKLKLSTDQVRQIAVLLSSPRQRSFRSGFGATAVATAEVEAKVLALLTPEQQAEWKRLLGPKSHPRSPLPGKTPEETAIYWFNNFDANRDGNLDSDEWQRSQNIRADFTKDGVDINKPMPRDVFVKHYLRIRHDVVASPSKQ
ncbi:EF-hand domain-containing protein [Bremerella sp. P1]|uniref:EF-hand domain-containing protein n=1 Tax=Bremerella sp. P1 TaxID=3026424 RepID=UPI002368A775|nr:EF-hand domain-containing protein [Bremerella sp. P1]WDI39909.1 EF-hand domain-containing protein [Bremerella sp. P1]